MYNRAVSILQDERKWRYLSDFWAFVMLVFVVVNFITKNHYEFMVIPMCVLYTGILTLYVGTKEFDRWYEKHHARHPGEWFVILWSVVIFALVAGSMVLGPEYTIHSDIVAVYIAVLSLFVVTQKSKNLHRERVHGGKETGPPRRSKKQRG